MAHLVCECGESFWQDEAWKPACIKCWLGRQDDASPRRVSKVMQTLDWALSELGRRQDLALAFKAHLPTMLATLEHLDGPESRWARLWLLRS